MFRETTGEGEMNVQEIRSIVGLCAYQDYTFEVQIDHRGAMYLQAHYTEPDVKTEAPEKQFTRRWFLSPAMCKGEIVQTVFKCVLTSMEHRTREHFKYQARAIFGPHFDVDSLWMICDDEHLDYRGKRELMGKEE